MSNSLSAVHPELVAEWSDRNLPLTPDSITFGSNKKVWWKGACGHEWETSVKARSNGEKCPICSGARVVTGINDLSTLKPELASEWSEKNKIKPTEVSIGSHKKVIWKCKLEHEWIATVKSRSINRTGCPYCSHNKVLAGFNDLATLFPEVADEWSDKNEKKPTEVMAFANSKAWWKCRTCGYEWNTLISTRSGGSTGIAVDEYAVTDKNGVESNGKIKCKFCGEEFDNYSELHKADRNCITQYGILREFGRRRHLLHSRIFECPQCENDSMIMLPNRKWLLKLYNQVKSLFNMQQRNENDKRVNNMLSGLEKIVQSIAEMRNANSDAHGVGSRRIAIRECEARLVMNSAITFCEYMISVHDK